MPIRRDRDGNIHEEKTERAPRRDEADAPTSGGGSLFDGFDSGFDQPTVKPRREREAEAAEEDPAADAEAEQLTRVVRRRTGGSESSSTGDEEASGADAMEDPPAGWLVVVQGPGQGNFVPVGYGFNTIGRDSSNRVPLGFGDENVSRNKHAVLVYESRARKFYVAHGEGKNVTLLDDTPLMTQQELENGSTIILGNTTLRFVALCSDSFDWEELGG